MRRSSFDERPCHLILEADESAERDGDPADEQRVRRAARGRDARDVDIRLAIIINHHHHYPSSSIISIHQYRSHFLEARRRDDGGCCGRCLLIVIEGGGSNCDRPMRCCLPGGIRPCSPL